MVENYDVIIVGAGIAGCGLAYNIVKSGFEGSVLVIDSRSPGDNFGAGHRNTFKRIVEEYNLPYIKKLKGFKIGFEDEILMTVDFEMYSVDYSRVCSFLLEKSGVKFVKDRAFSVKDSFLKTIKSKYKFKYLVDCSGPNLFLRKHFKLPLPFRFWIADAHFIDSDSDLDPNYAYYSWADDHNLEELCITKKGVYQLNWCYTKKVDFNLINPSPNNFLSKFDPSKIRFKNRAVTIVSPLLPLVYKKKYAFLGDSFGNTAPLSVFGLECALISSKILADAIREGDLESYERIWKRKYLDIYLKRLAIKIDLHHNTGIIKKMKNYPSKVKTLHVLKKNPDIFASLVGNQFQVPQGGEEFRKIYPRTRIFWIGFHYLYLRIKYFIQSLKYGIL